MTPIQAKFVALEKRKEEVKRFFDELESALNEVKTEIGLNGLFQDSEGTVYKIVETKGKWVDFSPISYTRTRRLTEERSPIPLALKEAEAAGFTVPRNNSESKISCRGP